MQVKALPLVHGRDIYTALIGNNVPHISAAADVRVALRRGGVPLEEGESYLVRVSWVLDTIEGFDTNNEHIVADLRRIMRASPPSPSTYLALTPPKPTTQLKSRVPQVEFPNTIPVCNIARSGLMHGYGLKHGDLPYLVRAQVDRYQAWCTDRVNLSRGVEYAQPVQTETVKKNIECIRGFLGFLSLRAHINISSGILLYWNPQYIAMFVSFLLARGVSKGQVIKHISVARKVGKYLGTTSKVGAEELHSRKMDEWLATLERQVGVVLPSPHKDPDAYPAAAKVHQWIVYLIDVALEAVSIDRKEGSLSCTNAKLVSGITKH